MASQMPPFKSTVRTKSDETHRHSESEEDAILAIMISPDDLDDVRWPSHVQRFLSVSSFSPVPYDAATWLRKAREHMMALVWTCLSPTIVFITYHTEHDHKVDLRDRLIKTLEQDVDKLVFGFTSGAATVEERLCWLELHALFHQMTLSPHTFAGLNEAGAQGDYDKYEYGFDDGEIKRFRTTCRLTAMTSMVHVRMQQAPADAIGPWLDQTLTDEVLKILVDKCWALRMKVSIHCISFILRRSAKASKRLADLLIGDGDDYKRWLEPTTTLLSLEQFQVSCERYERTHEDAHFVSAVVLVLGLVVVMADDQGAIALKIIKFSSGNGFLSILDHIIKYLAAEGGVEGVRSTVWLTLSRLLHPLPPDIAHVLLSESISHMHAAGCPTEELSSIAWMTCHRFTLSLAKPGQGQRPRVGHDFTWPSTKHSPIDIEGHRLRAGIDDGQAARGKAAMVKCLENVSHEIKDDKLYKCFAIYFLGPGCLSATTAPTAIQERIAKLKNEVQLSAVYSSTSKRTQYEPNRLVKAVHESGIMTFVNASSTKKTQTNRLKLLGFLLEIKNPPTTTWSKYFPAPTSEVKDAETPKTDVEMDALEKAGNRLRDFWKFLSKDIECANCQNGTCNALRHCLKTEEIAIWATRPFFPELSYERLLKQTNALITKVIYGGRSKARDTYLYGCEYANGPSVDQYARTHTTTDGMDEHRVHGVKHYGVHCGLERAQLNGLFEIRIPMLREWATASDGGFDDPFTAWRPCDFPYGFWRSPSQSETSNGRVTKHLSPLPYSAIAREWPFSLVWIDNGEDIIQPTKRRRQSPSPLDQV